MKSLASISQVVTHSHPSHRQRLLTASSNIEMENKNRPLCLGFLRNEHIFWQFKNLLNPRQNPFKLLHSSFSSLLLFWLCFNNLFISHAVFYICIFDHSSLYLFTTILLNAKLELSERTNIHSLARSSGQSFFSSFLGSADQCITGLDEDEIKCWQM